MKEDRLRLVYRQMSPGAAIAFLRVYENDGKVDGNADAMLVVVLVGAALSALLLLWGAGGGRIMWG